MRVTFEDLAQALTHLVETYPSRLAISTGWSGLLAPSGLPSPVSTQVLVELDELVV